MTPQPSAAHPPCPGAAHLRQATRPSRALPYRSIRAANTDTEESVPAAGEQFEPDDRIWRQVRHLWHT